MLVFDAVLDEVEARLAEFFESAAHRASRHSPQFRELWQEMRGSAMGGKRLRPRLVALTALELDRRIPVGPVVELATALELLHTALLLHDDVIDGDVERRGALNLVGAFAESAERAGLDPAAAERWGQSAAILAGDLLLTAAVRLTAGLDIDRERRDRIVDLVDESIFRAAAGELADVAFASGLVTPTPAEIREMMADKTAHYSVELPLRAGAILAGASSELDEQLTSIGRSLGIVFQIRDDLLGVFGAPEETGKSVSSDLREGKQTMLVAFARGTEAWTEAAASFGDEDLDADGAQRLRDALERSGARQRVEGALAAERDALVEVIRSGSLPSRLAERLAAEAQHAAERRA